MFKDENINNIMEEVKPSQYDLIFTQTDKNTTQNTKRNINKSKILNKIFINN